MRNVTLGFLVIKVRKRKQTWSTSWFLLSIERKENHFPRGSKVSFDIYFWQFYTQVSFPAWWYEDTMSRETLDARSQTCPLSFVLALGSHVTEGETSHCPESWTAPQVWAFDFQILLPYWELPASVLLHWWAKGIIKQPIYSYLWFWGLVWHQE